MSMIRQQVGLFLAALGWLGGCAATKPPNALKDCCAVEPHAGAASSSRDIAETTRERLGEARLCSLNVADSKAIVETAYDRVELTVITLDKSALGPLRHRARLLEGERDYATSSPEQATRTLVVPVHVSVETVRDGVKLVFKPDHLPQLPTLREAIESDTLAVASGAC